MKLSRLHLYTAVRQTLLSPEAKVADFSLLAGFEKHINHTTFSAIIHILNRIDCVDLPQIDHLGLEVPQ